MAKSFSWPQDAFYWGQNRLGSLFPLLLYPLLKTKLAHPIYLASFLNYVMLFFAWFVFSRGLEAKWKVLFCISVFLPHPTYYYNILIGHPYQAQFFALAISYNFLPHLLNKIQNKSTWIWLDYLKLLLSIFGFLLAFWISEMSAIFLIFIATFLFTDSTNRFLLKSNFRYFKKAFFLGASFFFFGLIYIYYLKSLFMPDPIYNKLFISSWSDIQLQFSYFFYQLKNAFFFKKHYSVFEGIFYYVLLINLAILSYLFFKKGHPQKQLITAFFISFFVSCGLLFFSSWNLRSQFDAKYYGLLYTFLWIGIGYAFQSYSNKIQWIVFLLLMFVNTTNAFTMIQRNFNYETVFDQNKLESEIPKGTLLGSYWRVFKIASIHEQLQPASNNISEARNWLKRDVYITNRNFYLFKDELNLLQHRGDTILYMNRRLIATQDSFLLSGIRLYKYTNLDANKLYISDWNESGFFLYLKDFYWQLRRYFFNY
jgi:hypothetical protein